MRLASLLQLTNNFSVDLYVEQTLRHAKLIVVRVLGGPGYWQYGLDEVLRLARGDGVKTAVISGAAFADPTLDFFSTVAKPHTDRLWTYLVEGGPDNFREFLRHCSLSDRSSGGTGRGADAVAEGRGLSAGWHTAISCQSLPPTPSVSLKGGG